MITGINRLQRPGRSYLHGVLRDAARPFAYRSGARRLLRAENAAGLRPLYGNHFMPVAFRYLDTPYGCEYGLSDAPRFTPAQPVAASAGEPHVPPRRRDDKPVTAPHDARPVTAASAREPESRMHEHVPQRPTETAAASQTAPAIDIRIPGADTRGTASRIEARVPAPALQRDSADPPASILKAEAKPAAQPETEKRTTQTEARPVVPAKPLPQRLPGNLSLKGLAEMLERQNFEKPAAARGETRDPDPDARRPSRLPLAAAAEPRPDTAAGASIATRVLPPEKRIASVKPAVAAAAVEPRRMPAAAKVSARRPELRMPAPRRIAPEERRTQQAAPRPDREPRKAGIARAPARATGHRQALSTRRVNVIRRTAPAAFWERSYLSSLELRLYR